MHADPSAVLLPGVGAPGGVQAGYGLSLTDLGRFEHAMFNAQARLDAHPVQASSNAFQVIGKPLQGLNDSLTSLQEMARAASSSGASMSVGDAVLLTARCHEFSLHCTLASTMATKTSDGVQQLFRQQS